MDVVLRVLMWVAIGLVVFVVLALIAVAILLYILVYARKMPSYGKFVFGDNLESDMSDPVEQVRVRLAKETEEYVESMEYDTMHTMSFDGLKLFAKLLKGDPQSKRVVIVVHGYRGLATMDFGGMIQFYHNKGYHVLMPDNRAHRNSEGKWLGFGWLDRRDVITWSKKLIRMFGPETEIILSGVSMGGATVMMASGEEDLPKQVKLIIEDCGYSSTVAQFESAFPKQFYFLRKPVLFFCNLISLLLNHYSLYKASSVKQIEKCTVPMLFFHGEKDTFVPTEMVYDNFDACNTFKKLRIIPNAGHAQGYDADPAGYEATVEAFLQDTIGV